MFNVDDLAFINAYRKSVTSGGSEIREPVVFGKDIIETVPFTLITLTDEQKFAVERAKKYALEQSIQNAVRKQMDQLQTQDMNNIKQTQALVLLSRIYVGSISFEVGEEEIRKSFSPYGPIKSISLSWDSALQKHKGFAFVEFEIPEAASLVLEQMNGFVIAGRGIKVGRPSNAPQTSSLETELRQDPGNKSRIYVTGVHPQLSDSDIQTVFEAFGAVRSCRLELDIKFGQPETTHKGYGWIEFETEQAAIAAVTNMNGFEIAGSLLRVGRAISPRAISGGASTATSASTTSAVAAAAASISAKVAAAEIKSIDVQPLDGTQAPHPPPTSGWGAGANVPPPGVFVPPVLAAPPLAPPVGIPAPQASATASAHWDDDDVVIPPQPIQDAYSPSAVSPVPDAGLSSVILLENMVGVTDVDAFLEEEVAEECSLYGHVLRVVVHVFGGGDAAVRIFVHFDCRDAAIAAVQGLNNRFFGGRQIEARFYPDEEFQMRKLDL